MSEFVSGTLAASALTKVESHLAGCRDCRALVAAMAQDAAADSNIQTVPHDKFSASQVTHLPKRILTVGDKVGRYLVLSTLGTGGMGVVFAAYDPQLDRKVALKLLRSGLQLATKDAQKRLRREAQAIAQLSHPNVVGVYDVGTTDDGDLYIAMEFVEGDTLTTWLKKYPRTWRDIIDVFLQAGKGLVAAHGSGLLHRDFKPDNVLVGGDGRVRVTDFGLARSMMVLEEESARGQTPHMPTALSASLTATGTVLGTPRYMPPEQLEGPDIDARADQFSFCVALYEALYGVHPLPGGTSESMRAKGDRALPPPEGQKVPLVIARAVSRGLERDRVKRYPTMAALMSELVLPAPKLPSRSIAAALAVVVIVGIGAATVLARREEPVVTDTTTPGTTKVLIDTINQLKAEISRIDNERKVLLERLKGMPATPDEVNDLRERLREKDEQIQLLIARVEEIKKPALIPPKKPMAAQSLAVLSAIADVNLDACFQEFGERPDDHGRAQKDTNLLVTMEVSPDGVAYNIKTKGDVPVPEPDPLTGKVPVVGESSLQVCINSAMARTRFPKGSEVLGIQVVIQWSQDMVNRSSKVVSHRPPTGKIDIE